MKQMKALMKISAAALFAFALLFAPATASAALRIGAAKSDITPAPGCYMGGYYMRGGRATGVHDPLFARAIVYDNGAARAAVVSLDLVIIGGVLVGEARAEIQKRFGIPPELVTISVTHTHSGPEGYYEEYGKYPRIVDPEMKKQIIDGIVSAVGRAVDGLQPATVGFLAFQLDKFSHNRHDPNGEVDRQAVLMIARNPEGTPITGFLNFAAHPTVMDADNLLLSGDWPGHFTALMEKQLGVEVFQYIQGATGNASPDIENGKGFDACADIANRLSTAITPRIADVPKSGDLAIAGRMETLELPVKTQKETTDFARALPGMKQQIKALDISEDEKDRRISWLDGKLGTEQFMTMLIKTMGRVKKKKTTTLVQALRLGDTVLMAMPGETIAEWGVKFRAEMAPHTVVIQAYANDHIGYIVNEKIGLEGGYEAAMSLVDWRGSEQIANKTLETAKAVMSE